MLHVARGHEIDQRTVLRRLAELQYTRNDMDFHRGTYRVRGDVIDIFPLKATTKPSVLNYSMMRWKAS